MSSEPARAIAPVAAPAANLSPEAAQVLAEVRAWPKPFLTPNRVGQWLGVTGETVIAMAERGDIGFVGFGMTGRIRIPKSAVLALLLLPGESITT